MTPSAIVRWIRAHYDKLIAFAAVGGLLYSVVFLTISVGNIQTKQRQFDDWLAQLTPQRPEAGPIDRAVFEAGRRALREPAQIVFDQWSNRMFVAELRVSCIECVKPIPYEATVCPFCGAEQTRKPVEVDIGQDTDRDGIPDVWETAHAMDPRDPLDAGHDADLDGFSNLEEYKAGTDVHDGESFPPPETKLVVTEVGAEPFQLKFMAVSTTTGGLIFQLNLREGGKTYWVRMDEPIEDTGFRVVGYEKKKSRQIRFGTEIEVEEHFLTLRSVDKQITLQKGRTYEHFELTAKLLFLLEDREIDVKVGARFDLKGREYEVDAIDRTGGRVLVRHRQTERTQWILRGMRESAGAPDSDEGP